MYFSSLKKFKNSKQEKKMSLSSVRVMPPITNYCFTQFDYGNQVAVEAFATGALPPS